MIFLDALLRFSGIGMLALLAILAWRDHRGWNSTPYLILTCISVAALFIGYAPVALHPPMSIIPVFWFLDIPHLVFVWLFALSLFGKDFRLRPFHVLIGVLYSAPILWIRLTYILPIPERPDWFIPYGSATSALLMFHLCYVTLKGRADDLLEKRRASRVYFVVLLTCVAVAAAATDLMPADNGIIERSTAKMAAIWIAIAWGTYWMLSFNRAVVSFADKPASGRDLDARDQALVDQLLAEMTGNQAFRINDLTIVTLAATLGISQHKLRQLINSSLGYPNFSSFLNRYRIAAAKDAFSSAESAHLPILTIAMDCGFKSISRFNKAFKDSEGMTPTEYRHSLPSPS